MNEPPVYRAPMRSRCESVPEGAAVERALRLGLCGMGGSLDTAPSALGVALRAVDARFGERTARRIERFASAPDGAFVWTRDIDALTWLGRLTGPWRYDPTLEAAHVDLVHVRSCEWIRDPVHPALIPDGVGASFGRGGRNWQRIGAPDVPGLTAALWDQLRDA